MTTSYGVRKKGSYAYDANLDRLGNALAGRIVSVLGDTIDKATLEVSYTNGPPHECPPDSVKFTTVDGRTFDVVTTFIQKNALLKGYSVVIEHVKPTGRFGRDRIWHECYGGEHFKTLASKLVEVVKP